MHDRDQHHAKKAAEHGAAAATEPRAAEHDGSEDVELTPDERMLAVALAQELSADERTKWFAELSPLTIEDAVARVRKLLSSRKENVS